MARTSKTIFVADKARGSAFEPAKQCAVVHRQPGELAPVMMGLDDRVVPPEQDLLIVTGRDDGPVGKDAHSGDRVFMPLEDRAWAKLLVRFPDPDGLVGGSREQSFAVRTEGQVHDHVAMTLEEPHQPAGGKVMDADGAHVLSRVLGQATARSQPAAIWRQGDGVDLALWSGADLA